MSKERWVFKTLGQSVGIAVASSIESGIVSSQNSGSDMASNLKATHSNAVGLSSLIRNVLVSYSMNGILSSCIFAEDFA